MPEEQQRPQYRHCAPCSTKGQPSLKPISQCREIEVGLQTVKVKDFETGTETLQDVPKVAWACLECLQADGVEV